MAAQESSKVCPKCFEVNDHGATFCVECGSPFSDDPADEGSDHEVYREITQANLHRIRGNYKDAVNTCLSILKRFPNNGTVHTLLGDIHAEQGELEQSSQWYEMALDLRPESENDRRKLEAVSKRISQQEVASTAKQLGIPESQPRTQQYVFVMAILIAIVGVGGFLIGNTMGANGTSEEPTVISDPIKVGSQPEAESDPMPVDTGESQEPSWSGTPSDSQLLAALHSGSEVCQRILAVQDDSRYSSVSLTALVSDTDDIHSVATDLATAIFTQFSQYIYVSIRLTDGQQVVFVVDVERVDYQRVVDEQLSPTEMMLNPYPEPSDD